MREIKFRAWDKVKKIWITKDNSESETTLDYDDNYLYHSCNYELEQFTGLPDKSGKEVFEGDIVEHPIKNFYFKIEFNDGGFVMWHSIACKYDFCKIIAKDCEVVGHIHKDGLYMATIPFKSLPKSQNKP